MAQVSLILEDIGDLNEGQVDITGIQVGESADGMMTAAQLLAVFLPRAIRSGWFLDRMFDFADELEAEQNAGREAAQAA